MPLATVIVPVYKTENYLPACIESLERQSYAYFEIIVVDDCSPGTCREIVHHYQESSNRIRCVRHEENRGLLSARLTGVKESSSKYVAFLDSDDTARPHFLATLVTTAEETGADIVGSARFRREADAFTIDGSEEIAAALCAQRIPNHNVWTKLFRRALFYRSPNLMLFGDVEHIVSVEDVVITLTVCAKADRFVQIGKVLVDYNKKRPDSSWNSIDAEGTLKSIREIASLFSYMRHLGVDGWESLALRIIDYFYTKKFLRTDVVTQKLVLEYLQRSAVAGDLRSTLLAAASTSELNEAAKKLLSRSKNVIT